MILRENANQQQPIKIILYRDTLEIKHPKDEDSRLGFIEPVHER